VTTVKRRNWLIATLAALFVLQTPLCVLACQLNAAPDEAGAEAHHASSCHEEAPSPRSSSEPRDAHGDCGCGDSYTAVLASADQTFSNVQTSPVIATKELEVPLNAIFSRTIEVRLSEADLPPPDILLLKSTLLI
jgi:hypothetical protein